VVLFFVFFGLFLWWLGLGWWWFLFVSFGFVVFGWLGGVGCGCGFFLVLVWFGFLCGWGGGCVFCVLSRRPLLAGSPPFSSFQFLRVSTPSPRHGAMFVGAELWV